MNYENGEIVRIISDCTQYGFIGTVVAEHDNRVILRLNTGLWTAESMDDVETINPDIQEGDYVKSPASFTARRVLSYDGAGECLELSGLDGLQRDIDCTLIRRLDPR